MHTALLSSWSSGKIHEALRLLSEQSTGGSERSGVLKINDTISLDGVSSRSVESLLKEKAS